MNVELLVPVFERTKDGSITLLTLGLGEHTQRAHGKNAAKLEEQLLGALREVARKMPARDVELFQAPRGIRLEKARVEVTLSGGDERKKVSGEIPIVIEPRWINDEERVEIAYHPEDATRSFPLRKDLGLEESAQAHFAKLWATWPEARVRAALSHGKERVRTIVFSIEPSSLLDSLPSEKTRAGIAMGGGSDADKRARGRKVLPRVGRSLTQLAIQGSLSPGLPRGREAGQLAMLLGSKKRQPAIVLGAPGAGKTTLLHRWLLDALTEDGYFVHKNVDRARDVWLVAGRRLIAGMTHLGDWEKRAIDLIDDARRDRCVLVVEDLHHFARIGRSRGSDRNLTDLFRGPLARREIVMVGEATEDQWRALEDEAPSFAGLFTKLHVPEATSAETFRLLVHEARVLEQKRKIKLGPYVLRSIVELATTVLPGRALPGKAIELARELARDAEEGKTIAEADVARLLSRKTGVPKSLLDRDDALDPVEIERRFAAEVVGQPEAVRVATDLVCRIKSGLVDPRRPYAVLLFTGPTGTGKTELAKCVADFLYGSSSRLLRFDMSELSGPDAPARLIGSRWAPDGLLTKNVQEQPFGVVLFDEIEKAHPSVLHLCLQLFEDGRLTDAAGNTAHFTHTVVIMTSNLGSRARPPVGFVDSPDAVLRDVAKAVREFFPPELWNRIDRTVPFRPLSREAAELVAEKEIEKLVSRRGLADRHVFVARSSAVRAHVAERAFKAEDGARSIKRYLEDGLGALLTSALAASRPGAVRLFHLFEARGALTVEHETLDEVTPWAARYPLEALIDAPVDGLRAELVHARVILHEIDESGAMERVVERMRRAFDDVARGRADRSSELFHLEALRDAITALRERVDELLPRDRQSDYEDLERRDFGTMEIPTGDVWRAPHARVRLFGRRPSAGADRDRGGGREEMLRALADARFLRRAIDRVDEPGEHAVVLELVRGGRHLERERFERAPAGLFEWLRDAYRGAFGAVTSYAYRAADGRLLAGKGDLDDRALQASGVARLAMLVEGLGARDLATLEHGSHVRTSNAVGPEIVRVRVLPVIGAISPRDVIERFEADSAAYDASVARGESAPNPRALLPVVRTLRFDPASIEGAPATLEIEDYAIGWAAELHVKKLADALADLWLFWRGRVDEGGGR